MANLFNNVPGKGGRTVAAIVLLVVVTVANTYGWGTESLDADFVSSIQVVLAGLAGIFYRLK